MSPGLKNLVSTAIGEEASSVKTLSTSPGARVAAPTLTHLLELPLNSPGKPLPELSVTEETEVSIASNLTKTEVPTKSQESGAPLHTEAPSSLQKTEQLVEVVEPVETIEVTSQVEASSSLKSGEESSRSVEKVISVEIDKPDETKEKSTVKETEVVSIAEPERESAIKEEHPEPSITFESEVEVSQNQEVEKKIEETSVEPTVLKTEPVDEEEAVNEDEDKTVDEGNDESSDEKGEEKELKTAEADNASKSEIGTPKVNRRPQRGIRKKVVNHEADTTPDEKNKISEPGPTTRRSSGRKGTQSDEHDTESVNEVVEPNTPVGIGKKKTSLPPPLYVPSASPAPSSGIDSTPNSPTSSVSTVA